MNEKDDAVLEVAMAAFRRHNTNGGDREYVIKAVVPEQLAEAIVDSDDVADLIGTTLMPQVRRSLQTARDDTDTPGFMTGPDDFRVMGWCGTGVLYALVAVSVPFVRARLTHDGLPNSDKAFSRAVSSAVGELLWQAVQDGRIDRDEVEKTPYRVLMEAVEKMRGAAEKGGDDEGVRH